MKKVIAAALLAAALAAGCRLSLWAGSHELNIPPKPAEEPTPTATAP